MEKKRILITGLCGFIASHLTEHILKNTDWEIVGLDRFNPAATTKRLTDMEIWESQKHRVKFVYWDLKARPNEYLIREIGRVDYIAHLAANSDVDDSIKNPVECFLDNGLGTVHMLELARELKPKKFLYFSTDEVYSTAPDGVFYKEGDRHNPGNPYSAGKSAGEMACAAYANTYGLNIIITNCMNVFGERQASTKFIPKTVKYILEGEKLQIHANEDKTKAGQRHYLHARNISFAVVRLLEECEEYLDKIDSSKGRFNIVGEEEIDNESLALLIEKYLQKWFYQRLNVQTTAKLDYELVDFHSSRPGHDLRYALDGEKLKKFNIVYPKSFKESLEKTVFWILDHQEWL